jgi:UPF0716 family protein affecting phage T7 exclusion
MRLPLTLLLIGLPLAEIATFIQVGQWFGLGPTLALVLLAGLAGILLIRHQSLATLGAVRAALARNQVPTAELADAACVLIAGFLLILPGFISDIVALLLLVRPLRRAIFRRIGWRTADTRRGATIIAGEYHEIVEPGPGDPPAPNTPVSRWGGAR